MLQNSANRCTSEESEGSKQHGQDTVSSEVKMLFHYCAHSENIMVAMDLS